MAGAWYGNDGAGIWRLLCVRGDDVSMGAGDPVSVIPTGSTSFPRRRESTSPIDNLKSTIHSRTHPPSFPRGLRHSRVGGNPSPT